MQRLKTNTMPNSTELNPQEWATGKKMGVKIKIAGVVSRKVPTNNKKTLIINKIIILFSEIFVSKLPTALGISTNEITQDIIEDTPTKKIMIPVISADSLYIG